MLFEPGMSCQLCSFTTFYVCVILANKMMMIMMMMTSGALQHCVATDGLRVDRRSWIRRFRTRQTVDGNGARVRSISMRVSQPCPHQIT